MGITRKEHQIGLEIDFRNGFAGLEGFPDALKGLDIIYETGRLFALLLRQ
jgi:hypothetical protein